MLTHMHNGGVHIVVLAHLQRRCSLKGREGFRRFWKNEVHIFHYARGRVEEKAKSHECLSLINTPQTQG